MNAFFAKAIVAAVLAGSTTCALAQEITLKVHHFLGPQSTLHAKVLVPWCDKLAKESGNRIKCQIYPAMQLGGSPPQLYDQARDGVVDVSYTLAGYAANRFPRIEVFELPFMITGAEAASRAAWDFYEGYAQDEFAETKLIAINVHGPGNIFTTKKPVGKLADLRGLKLRAPTRQTNKMLGLMGATPVGMPVPQVPDALSKGVIDGAVVPYEVAPAIKLNELVKHVAETDRSFNALYTAVFIVAMNKARYDSLPPDLKKVIDANSGREVSAQFGRALADADVSAREKVVASRVNISIIPRAELETWKKVTEPVYEDWVKDLAAKGHDGRKLLQAAQDLVKKHSK